MNTKTVYVIAPAKLPMSRALRWSYYLCRNLNKAGIDNLLIAFSDSENVKTLDGIKIKPIVVNIKNRYVKELMFSIKTFAFIVKNRKNIQLLHLNGVIANIMGAFASRLLNIPCVVFCTDIIEQVYVSYGLPFPSIGSGMASAFHKFYAHTGDAVVTDTKFGKKFLIENEGVKGDRILPVPHGFDNKIFYPRKKSQKIIKKYGLEDKKVILYHGDIGYDDGIDILIDSIKYLEDLKDKIKIVLVGGGESEFENLKKRVAKEGLSDIITFTDWVEFKDVADYLSVCDIYIDPLRFSTDTNIKLPSKVMEVMGMGLPILASDLDGLKSEFKDGYNILFFKQENSKDLAKKLSLLLNRDSLRKKLGENAYKTSKKYLWDIIIEKEIEFMKKRNLLQVSKRKNIRS
jgi:glycosyltransferase involved in cell wall biosynthesis